MSDEVPEYQNWPASQEERKALARDVFGRYLVYTYDSWLDDANKMLSEYSGFKSTAAGNS